MEARAVVGREKSLLSDPGSEVRRKRKCEQNRWDEKKKKMARTPQVRRCTRHDTHAVTLRTQRHSGTGRIRSTSIKLERYLVLNKNPDRVLLLLRSLRA